MARDGKSGRAAPRTARPASTQRRRGGLSDMLAMDSERSARVLLLGGVGLIILVALAFVAFGYWYGEIRPQGRTVLKVEDTKVSFASMKRRMEHELRLNANLWQQIQALPEYTYIQLLNELTLIHRAESDLGVTVTDEEVEERLRIRIGAAPDAEPRVFADRFRDALEESGLNEDEYRRYIRGGLIGERVQEKFRNEVPAEVEQAKVEVITVDDEETAQQAIDRIESGEAFDVVARDLSTSPDADATGGLSEFRYDGQFPEAFNEYAFSSEPGTLSEPLATNGAAPYYVVRVVERSPQALTEQQRTTYTNQQYQDWLADMQQGLAVERDWDQADQTEALLDVLDDVPPPEQQPPPAAQPTVEINPSPAASDTAASGEATPAAVATTESSEPDPSGAPQPDAGQ